MTPLPPLLIACNLQEYQGEVRQRYSLADIRATDYAAESRRLLALITPTAA